jgi:hypothetical protein
MELIWQGKLDSHMTLPSSSDKGYTRIGTFVQISNRLVQAVVNARLESTTWKNVHFQGVNDLYEDYSKKCKLYYKNTMVFLYKL